MSTVLVLEGYTPDSIFNDNGKPRNFVENHYQKNRQYTNDFQVIPIDDNNDNNDNNENNICMEKTSTTEEAENIFGQIIHNHSLKISCITGLLTGGIIGAAGAAGVWGLHKMYKTITRTEELKESDEEQYEVTV